MARRKQHEGLQNCYDDGYDGHVHDDARFCHEITVGDPSLSLLLNTSGHRPAGFFWKKENDNMNTYMKNMITANYDSLRM